MANKKVPSKRDLENDANETALREDLFSQNLITGEDLGVESEKQMSAGSQTSGFDYNRITDLDTDETLSDAEALSADFDSITDTNSLTSAATLSGAYAANWESDEDAEDEEEGDEDADYLDEEAEDAVAERMAKDNSMGITENTDEETVRKYIRAHRKDIRENVPEKTSGHH